MKYNLDIPGWMWERDLQILNTLASHVPENGNILEVGSFVGRSTVALYAGKPANATLEVIDMFTVSKIYPTAIDSGWIDGSLSKVKAIKNIAKETGSWLEAFKYCVTPEIFDQLVVNVTTSRNYEMTKHFDMVFIDANHKEEEVVYDIKKYSADENTLLVGDDFIDRHPGISTALSKVRWNIPRTIIIPEYSKLWIMVPTSGYWKEFFQKNTLL
jgi:hypothetical protein